MKSLPIEHRRMNPLVFLSLAILLLSAGCGFPKMGSGDTGKGTGNAVLGITTPSARSVVVESTNLEVRASITLLDDADTPISPPIEKSLNFDSIRQLAHTVNIPFNDIAPGRYSVGINIWGDCTAYGTKVRTRLFTGTGGFMVDSARSTACLVVPTMEKAKGMRVTVTLPPEDGLRRAHLSTWNDTFVKVLEPGVTTVVFDVNEPMASATNVLMLNVYRDGDYGPYLSGNGPIEMVPAHRTIAEVVDVVDGALEIFAELEPLPDDAVIGAALGGSVE